MRRDRAALLRGGALPRSGQGVGARLAGGAPGYGAASRPPWTRR